MRIDGKSERRQAGKAVGKTWRKAFLAVLGVMRLQRSRDHAMLSYNDLPGKSVLIYIYTYLWQVQREIGCETRRCF